jgi:hypothetical protein
MVLQAGPGFFSEGSAVEGEDWVSLNDVAESAVFFDWFFWPATERDGAARSKTVTVPMIAG